MLKNKAMMISGLGLGLLGLGGVASADEVSTQNYTVVAGDTVSNIATKFNSTVSEIDSLNNFKDVNMIFVGEVIKVPSNTLKTNNTTYQTTKPVSVATPVQQSQKYTAPKTVNSVPTTQKQVTNNVSNSGSSAKSWIAMKESGGSYSARNGKYIGKYQLDAAYLNGDFSPANQERVAENYVKQRYGSWEAAKNHHLTHGWY